MPCSLLSANLHLLILIVPTTIFNEDGLCLGSDFNGIPTWVFGIVEVKAY
jgi:hypothetical protein